MAASYWSPDKEMAALLRQLDEDELGSFAEAMSEQNSQEVLYSACHEIYLRTKSDRDLTILIDTAETFLSAMLAKSGKTETYAVVATETSKLRREKFERNLQVVDLERAIELIGEAISVTSDSSKSTMRLEYLSSLLDIKDNLPQGSAKEDPDDNEDSILRGLPNLRIQLSSASEDYISDDYIAAIQSKLESPNISIRERLRYASCLRNTFEDRFEDTRSAEYLAPAIEAAKIAIDAASRVNIPQHLKDLVQADASYDLGMLLVESRLALNEQDDKELDYTIKCLEEAEKIEAPRRRQVRMNSLSMILWERYEKKKDISDLRRSVEMAYEALQHVSEDDTRSRPGLLYNYGSKLRVLYDATTEEGLLDRAATYVEKALTALPGIQRRDHRWPAYTTERAGHLLRKFTATGDLKYLNEGIERCYAVDDIRKSSSVQLPGTPGWHLEVLAGLLRLRYDRLEVKEDITAAVNAAKQSVESLPAGHKDLALRRCNLSGLYWRRFSRYHEPEDIDSAITAATQALSAIGDGSAYKATILSTLSGIFTARYTITHNVDDMDEAVSKAAEATKEASEDNISQLVNRNNLARTLLLRASSGKVDKLAYLNQAIDLFQSVVDNTQPDSPDYASRLLNLGIAFEQRHEMTRELTDLDDAAAALDRCSQCAHGSPLHRTAAAARAADLHLSQKRFTEAESLLRRAVSLLRNVSPRILHQHDQQHMLRRFAGLATLATSVALEANTTNTTTRDVDADADTAEDALSLLEDGRGIILGLLFEIRSDVALLRQKHPTLSARFERLRDELDMPAISLVSGSTAIQPHVVLTHRQRLVEEFDDVVSEIRRHEGFHSFLKAPDMADLKSGVFQSVRDAGIIVVINVSRIRSDAFIVQADQQVRQLQLPGLQLKEIREWVVLLKSGRITEFEMFKLLEWLWDMLASPVISHIKADPRTVSGSGYAREPNRIWWIPTGPLSLLPIHAAGKYRVDENSSSSPPANILDRVVSSYSPSIKALLFSRRSTSRNGHLGQPTMHRSLLISMGETPDCRTLRYAKQEVEMVKQSLSMSRMMQNSGVEGEGESRGDDPVVRVLHEPDKAAVLTGLRASPAILHFAGHGRSDLEDPLQSALLVKDWQTDLLTVKDLIALKLHENGNNNDCQPPFLAYLSACSTGSNRVDDLLDEGIHLMSACQLAGFQHVVGSLWAVSDRHCVDVARAVFTSVGATGRGSEQMVAIGLQEGVKKLRDQRRAGAGRRCVAHDGHESGDDDDDDDDDDNDGIESDNGEEDEGIDDRAGYGASSHATRHHSIRSDPRIWAAYIHIGL